MSTLDFDQYSTLTFDYFGTLVDWERSLLAPLRAITDRGGAIPTNAEINATFTTLDSDIKSEAYQPYTDVLAALTRAFAKRFGITASDDDVSAVIDAAANARPFAETTELLPQWARDRRLVVISNTDDAIISRTLKHMPVQFDEIITSEQARTYKADIGIFQVALERIATPGDTVLHVAEWLAEAAPARALGMGSVWVKRTDWAHIGGAGKPDVTVDTLTELDAMMYKREG